jgi:hypothetical protein
MADSAIEYTGQNVAIRDPNHTTAQGTGVAKCDSPLFSDAIPLAVRSHPRPALQMIPSW